ncbi:hypothetical protein [Mesorhizobium sp. M0037]|uniref:hypothetical protein n=1 Tax=unclassified Mesorhizobium TaxID=325217 RepID=UPI00333D92FA
MSKPNTPSEFYEAIGLAVTQWSRVEDAFCDVFCRLVLCAISGKGTGNPTGEGYFILGNVFYSSTNFRGRMEIMDHMVGRLVLKEPALLAEWNRIKNKASVLYARRNVLAHGTVWGSQEPETIRYSIFDSKARQEMDYTRICAATPSFSRFAERITAFAIAVNAHLAGRV